MRLGSGFGVSPAHAIVIEKEISCGRFFPARERKRRRALKRVFLWEERESSPSQARMFAPTNLINILNKFLQHNI